MLNQKNKSDKYPDSVFVAKLGKTVGLKGDLKLHIDSDFEEQFLHKKEWSSSKGNLKIETVDLEKKLIKFENFNSPEDAQKLVNAKLFSTFDETREFCELDEDEFFWFDIVGLKVIEKDSNEFLGTVQEIERIVNLDYLLIKTADELVSQKFAKKFLIPYIDRYILDVNLEKKEVFVISGKELLEAS
jgi:16S rRNA processing protein RimM